MKVALQQYKSSPRQYLLGWLSVIVLLIEVSGLIVINSFHLKEPLVTDLIYRTIGAAVVFMLAFLPVKMIVIDTINSTIYTERRLFYVKLIFNRKPLPNIDYVSAFCQLQSDWDNQGNVTSSYIYDVNIWFGNKHIKLCSQYTAEQALLSARELALALNCNLLDATSPEGSHWVSLPST